MQVFPRETTDYIGSYVGTGTYGIANKTSVTFPFVPKLVFIFGPGTSGTTPTTQMLMENVIPNSISVGGFYLTQTFWGTTVSWYNASSDSRYQANGSGNTYYYFGIS